jgi:hypothetical protein
MLAIWECIWTWTSSGMSSVWAYANSESEKSLHLKGTQRTSNERASDLFRALRPKVKIQTCQSP